MRAKLIVLTLAVQVCTVAVLFAVSGEETQAYPMEAGYIVNNSDRNLDLVYYEGTPAQMTFEKMPVREKRSKVHANARVFYKKMKNLRCELRELDSQSVYRCALDLRKL